MPTNHIGVFGFRYTLSEGRVEIKKSSTYKISNKNGNSNRIKDLKDTNTVKELYELVLSKHV